MLIEGFRERRHFMVSVEDAAALGHGAPLWSRRRVGRLQLDVFAQEGEARLISTGDPERDVFHEYAHRFRVFIPAVWLRTRAAQETFRRVLAHEKPAHTAFDLCLVEPSFKVGVQASLGLDTIIGDVPEARLACRDSADGALCEKPGARLGIDTVIRTGRALLAKAPLKSGTGVGVNTIVN